jgi:hypothetical protein
MLGSPEFRVRGFASAGHPRVRAGECLVETIYSSEASDAIEVWQPRMRVGDVTRIGEGAADDVFHSATSMWHE